MTLIKRYYGIVILLIAIISYLVFRAYNRYSFNSIAKSPQIEDIYIFCDSNSYSPYRLDKIMNDSLYFFSHPYDFKMSIPLLEQIQEDSFNSLIHYIYPSDEIDRLVEEGKIVKIYR